MMHVGCAAKQQAPLKYSTTKSVTFSYFSSSGTVDLLLEFPAIALVLGSVTRCPITFTENHPAIAQVERICISQTH